MSLTFLVRNPLTGKHNTEQSLLPPRLFKILPGPGLGLAMFSNKGFYSVKRRLAACVEHSWLLLLYVLWPHALNSHTCAQSHHSY